MVLPVAGTQQSRVSVYFRNLYISRNRDMAGREQRVSPTLVSLTFKGAIVCVSLCLVADPVADIAVLFFICIVGILGI